MKEQICMECGEATECYKEVRDSDEVLVGVICMSCDMDKDDDKMEIEGT